MRKPCANHAKTSHRLVQTCVNQFISENISSAWLLKLPLQQGEAALPAEIKADEWDAV
jgi:hypothetical protein